MGAPPPFAVVEIPKAARRLIHMFNATHANITVTTYTLLYRGPKHIENLISIPVSIFYILIFISGMIGNILVCVVVKKKAALQTATNFYLFSLAISDISLLCLGLPNDLSVFWEQYPWRLGLTACKTRAFVSELSSYSSVLIILAFTVERYLAVCHPMLTFNISSLTRAKYVIAGVWVVAFLAATPVFYYTKIYYLDFPPNSTNIVEDSGFCGMLIADDPNRPYVYEYSAIVSFVLPLIAMTYMYWQMGKAIKSSGSDIRTRTEAEQRTTEATVRMLSVVVITFFFCWAPFHFQRLFYVYMSSSKYYQVVNEWLFYITGFFYYVSSTANPILYSLMSSKFRAAFVDTICETFGEVFPQVYETFNRPNPSERPTLGRTRTGAGSSTNRRRTRSVRFDERFSPPTSVSRPEYMTASVTSSSQVTVPEYFEMGVVTSSSTRVPEYSRVNASASSTMRLPECTTSHDTASSSSNPPDYSQIDDSESLAMKPPKYSRAHVSTSSSVNVPDNSCMDASESSAMNPPKYSKAHVSTSSSVNVPDYSCMEASESSAMQPPKYSRAHVSTSSSVNVPDYSYMEIPESSAMKPPKYSRAVVSTSSSVKVPDYSYMEIPESSAMKPPKYCRTHVSTSSFVNVPDYSYEDISESSDMKPPKYSRAHVRTSSSIEVPDHSQMDIPSSTTAKPKKRSRAPATTSSSLSAPDYSRAEVSSSVRLPEYSRADVAASFNANVPEYSRSGNTSTAIRVPEHSRAVIRAASAIRVPEYSRASRQSSSDTNAPEYSRAVATVFPTVKVSEHSKAGTTDSRDVQIHLRSILKVPGPSAERFLSNTTARVPLKPLARVPTGLTARVPPYVPSSTPGYPARRASADPTVSFFPGDSARLLETTQVPVAPQRRFNSLCRYEPITEDELEQLKNSPKETYI